MASTVNPQITDSITETNTEAVGMSPGVAMGTLYQAAAQAMGAALLNSTNAQQQGNQIAEAITSTGSKLIMSLAS